MPRAWGRSLFPSPVSPLPPPSDPLCINWALLSFDAGYAAKHEHSGAEHGTLSYAGVYEQVAKGKLTFHREVRAKSPNGTLTVESRFSWPLGAVSKVLAMNDFSAALPWTPNSGLAKAGLSRPHAIATLKLDHASQAV